MTVTDLATRRVTVGGSEAAAACGVDPYRSRVNLWARKRGLISEPEPSEAMEWGTLIEPVILGVLASEYGYETWAGSEFRDDDRPWCVGHPDAFAREGDGPAIVVDAKTTSGWNAQAWAPDDAPTAYVLQLQHYMHLTGLDRGLLACLIGGQRLELRTVNRDEHAIGLMLALEAEFVGLCTSGTWPDPVGSSSDADTLRAMFPAGETGKSVRLDRAGMRLVDEYRIVDRAYQRSKTQRDALKQRLQVLMGDAEVAESLGGDVLAKWTTYMRQGQPARRFTITANGGDHDND